MTRSCKSTRRHAIEIMNNLMYLRDACFQAIHTNMPTRIRTLTLSWLHVFDSKRAASQRHFRLLHPIQIADESFDSIFNGNIVHYTTAFIHQVRYTTVDYAEDKVSDDSSVIFKTGSTMSFGQIRRIFTVNNADPLFYIDVIPEMSEFRCGSETEIFLYPYIQTGSMTEGLNQIFIDSENIVEKCVFFPRPDGTCTFYRFPNLTESS